MRKLIIILFIIPLVSCSDLSSDSQEVCELLKELEAMESKIYEAANYELGNEDKAKEYEDLESKLDEKVDEFRTKIDVIKSKYNVDEFQSYLLENCEVAKELKELGETFEEIGETFEELGEVSGTEIGGDWASDEEYYEDEEDMYETWDDEYWNDEGEWDDEVADYETPSESSSSSPNGTYKYSDGDTELSITIIGNMWSGTSKLCLYCDVEYDNGVLKGNKLYDSSGYIEVGYTDNTYLSINYASRMVTLTKE